MVFKRLENKSIKFSKYCLNTYKIKMLYIVKSLIKLGFKTINFYYFLTGIKVWKVSSIMSERINSFFKRSLKIDNTAFFVELSLEAAEYAKNIMTTSNGLK